MTSKTRWVEPLRYAAALADEENLVLLYSGTDAGKRSFLAWGLRDTITNLEGLRKAEGKWFGWLGYGARLQLEDLGSSDETRVPLGDVFFARFENVVEFDHESQTLSYSGADPSIQPSAFLDSRVKPENDEFVNNHERVDEWGKNYKS